MSFPTADDIDLVIPYGLTFAFGFQLTDENGDPEDLTGWKIALQMRANSDDSATVLDLTSDPAAGITVVDPVTGTVDVLVTPADTLLPPGQLGRLQAVMISADDPPTILPIFSGNYFVDPSPWRATP